MCTLADRHAQIEQAVQHIKPGRVEWKKRLEGISEVFKPHKNRGRIVLYYELLEELKKDVRKFRAENDLTMDWRLDCEEELGTFFNRYVIECAESERKDVAPEDKVAKDKAPKDKVVKDKAPKDKVPEDKVAKDKAPKDKARKDKAPKDVVAKDTAVEDNSYDISVVLLKILVVNFLFLYISVAFFDAM